MIADKQKIRAVDHEIAAHLEKTHLLINPAPEMHPGATVMFTRLVKNGLHRG